MSKQTKRIKDKDIKNFSPEKRYQLEGKFNLDLYYDDLKNYPGFFDKNGWPLFGVYDPYSLRHPITEEFWYTNPRIPTEEEADKNYQHWFRLANNLLEHKVELAKLRKIKFIPENSEFGDYQSPGDIEKTVNNLVDLLMRIEKLMFDKNFCFDLFFYWGDFREILQQLEKQIPQTVHVWSRQIHKKKKYNIDAQKKFYLHWRRKYQGQGVSIIKCNKLLLELINDLKSKKRKCPRGFPLRWFNVFLPKEGSTDRKFTWFIYEDYTDDLFAAKLLASTPDEFPRIPSIDMKDYPFK